MNPLVDSIGAALGTTYAIYAFVLLLTSALAVHWLVLGAFVHFYQEDVSRRLMLIVEVIYGLLNPLVYLLVFDPACFPRVHTRALSLFGFGVLAAYWVFRAVGRISTQSETAIVAVRRGFLKVALGTILAFSARDLVGFVSSSWDGALGILHQFLTAAFCLPLYGLPALIVSRQLAESDDRLKTKRGDSFFLAGPQRARRFGDALLVLAAATVVLVNLRHDEGSVRERLLQLRPRIEHAARLQRIPPRLIASIIEVNQAEGVSLLHSALEQIGAAVWLEDPKSHILLAEALNPSLGLGQIKPITALTALGITRTPRAPRLGKEYREVPERLPDWDSFPTGGLTPPLEPGAGKAYVVHALLDDERNVEFCAYILGLYVRQWDDQQPSVDIRHRPEILATLYSLGFEKSHPKPEPRSNSFGELVRTAYESPWMQTNFAAEPNDAL
jgi:hypothetical protein